MEDNKAKKPQSVKTPKFWTTYTKGSYIVFAAIAVQILLDGILLPIFINFHLDIALYIFAIASTLLALFTGVAVIFINRRYGDDINYFLSGIATQLDCFSRGNVQIGDRRSDIAPLNKLQAEVNNALSKFSDYTINCENDSFEIDLRKKTSEGIILDAASFENALFRELQNSNSYRTALLYFRLQGIEGETSQAMGDLHKEIMAKFPNSVIGQYDENTYSVYLFVVESLIGLESQCKDFVSLFNKLYLDQSGDVANVVSCKIGGGVRPYVPMGNLRDNALANLEKTKTVEIDFGSKRASYLPIVRSEKNRRVAMLRSIEAYQSQLFDAVSFLDQCEVMNDLCRWFALSMGFEHGGVLLYYPRNNTYRVLLEGNKDKNKPCFKSNDKTTGIPAEGIDKLYALSEKDLSFSCGDVKKLDAELGNYLMNLGINSFYFFPVERAGGKLGLVYLTSSSTKEEISLMDREYFNIFSSFCTCFSITERDAFFSRAATSLLEDLSAKTESYLYTINRNSYEITFMSNNMKTAFPKAKTGDICYKQFRSNHDAPCSHCPLAGGNDHRIIEAVSPLECEVSLLQLRGLNDEESTVMIQPTLNANGADSQLVDSMLAIKNRQALNLAVAKAFKLGSSGYLFSLRYLNVDSVLSSVPDSDENLLMSCLLKPLIDSGFSDLLYRYDNKSLTFVLKGYNKAKLIDFAEQVAEIVSDEIEFQNNRFVPQACFSIISFPTEAKSAHEAGKLIDSELERSAKFGTGYLLEVANNHPRKALRSSYIIDLLNDSLSKDKMSFDVLLNYSNPEQRPVGGDILSRLYNESGQPIAPNQYIPLARANGLISKIDLAAIKAAGKLYSEYAFGIFKTVGIKNLYVRVSPESILDPDFAQSARNLFSSYRFPKNYLVFVIDSVFLLKFPDNVQKLIEALSPLGVLFEAANFEPNSMGLDLLSHFKMNGLSTARHVIGDASSTQSDYSNLSRFLSNCAQKNLLVTISGIENEGENEIAKHLSSAQRVQGFYFKKPLNEEEFIKELNYGA